jgi:hypothetical protein
MSSPCLGLGGRLRHSSLHHDPAGSGEFARTHSESFFRKIDMGLIDVEVQNRLSGSHTGCSAGWFSESSSHPFLESVGACCGYHTVLSEDNMRVWSKADNVTCLAKCVEENLVRSDTGCLKRIVTNLDWSLNNQADLIVKARLRVTHGELGDSQCG